MTSDTPGSGTPGWGEPPQPAPQAPQPGDWPAELTPPDAPAAPAQPAAPVPPGVAPVPATIPEPQAPAPPAWQQPAPVPAAIPEPQAPAAPQPTWGAPPPQQPGGQWGAPPPQQPGGQWGAPPPQQPAGWAPQPGAPGGVPPAGWAPQPAKSGNGCLKACLIVGIIGVVLVVIAGIAFAILAQKLVSSLPVNSDGSMKECTFISNAQLATTLGPDAVAFPLDGFLGDIVKAPIDDRLLKNADDCWLLSNMKTTDAGVFGRLAKQDDGNAAATFAAAKSAGARTYYAGDVPGVGDEAFCTGGGDGLGFGVFARRGNTLVYVSLFDAVAMTEDATVSPDGVKYSPSICDLSGQIATEILP